MSENDRREASDQEISMETPEADAVEQHTSLREEESPDYPRDVSFDVNEADAADQERLVELDEDDYR